MEFDLCQCDERYDLNAVELFYAPDLQNHDQGEGYLLFTVQLGNNFSLGQHFVILLSQRMSI